MKIIRALDRGHFNFGWLEAYHSFSFGEYYDPNRMGYKSLRVINEDRIQGGQGFPTHGHRDMEIITYVISGALAHKDSMGNGSTIQPGDVQYMSAGTGVRHSEFSASDKMTHLLQIWIMPDKAGYAPAYAQKNFDKSLRRNHLQLIVSNDGRDGSIAVRQDANIFSAELSKEAKLSYSPSKSRALYLQLIHGSIKVAGETLKAGDALETEDSIEILGLEDKSEFLLFDLA